MTRKISLDAVINAVRLALQGSAPSSPAAGYIYTYGKTADKRLYMKDELGTETDISGSVNGPASSTDNAIVRWDGAGGKTSQDSAVTVGDTGALTFPDNIRQTFNPGADAAGLNVGSIAGDPGTPSNGDLWYDSTANELTARINGSNVALGAGGGGSVGTDVIWDAKGDLAGGTGANTASRLAVGTNGQVLTADSAEATGMKWATPASGTLLKNYWSPDVSPASPTSQDDEFDNGSLDVKWTEFDPNTVLTVSEDSTYKFLRLTQATRVGKNVTGIYQALPAGDFTIWCKLSFSGFRLNYQLAGLALWEDPTNTTKSLLMNGLTMNATSILWEANKFTDHNTFSANVVSATWTHPQAYLRIRRNGTNYYHAVSAEGIDWLEYATAGNPLAVPTQFGVFCDNENIGLTIETRFHFFRYVASDVGANGILAGRAAGIYA